MPGGSTRAARRRRPHSSAARRDRWHRCGGEAGALHPTVDAGDRPGRGGRPGVAASDAVHRSLGGCARTVRHEARDAHVRTVGRRDDVTLSSPAPGKRASWQSCSAGPQRGRRPVRIACSAPATASPPGGRTNVRPARWTGWADVKLLWVIDDVGAPGHGGPSGDLWLVGAGESVDGIAEPVEVLGEERQQQVAGESPHPLRSDAGGGEHAGDGAAGAHGEERDVHEAHVRGAGDACGVTGTGEPIDGCASRLGPASVRRRARPGRWRSRPPRRRRRSARTRGGRRGSGGRGGAARPCRPRSRSPRRGWPTLGIVRRRGTIRGPRCHRRSVRTRRPT